MPCYQVNMLSVKIEAADKALLEKALNNLKLKYQRLNDNFYIDCGVGSIVIEGEQARLPNSLQNKLNEIKQAYSLAVIEQAAEEFSWTVSEEEDQIVLRRYSYD